MVEKSQTMGWYYLWSCLFVKKFWKICCRKKETQWNKKILDLILTKSLPKMQKKLNLLPKKRKHSEVKVILKCIFGKTIGLIWSKILILAKSLGEIKKSFWNFLKIAARKAEQWAETFLKPILAKSFFPIWYRILILSI